MSKSPRCWRLSPRRWSLPDFSASRCCAASFCCCCPRPTPRSCSFHATFVPGLTAPVALMIASLCADLDLAALHDFRAHHLRDGRQFSGRPADRPAGAHNDVDGLRLRRADRAARRARDLGVQRHGRFPHLSPMEACCSKSSWWSCSAAYRCAADAAACATSSSAPALIAVLRNGMTLFDLSTQTQDVLKGLVLVVAIVNRQLLQPQRHGDRYGRRSLKQSRNTKEEDMVPDKKALRQQSRLCALRIACARRRARAQADSNMAGQEGHLRADLDGHHA